MLNVLHLHACRCLKQTVTPWSMTADSLKLKIIVGNKQIS